MTLCCQVAQDWLELVLVLRAMLGDPWLPHLGSASLAHRLAVVHLQWVLASSQEDSLPH